VRKKEKVLGRIKVGLAIVRHKDAVERVVEGVSYDDITGSSFEDIVNIDNAVCTR
jgi:hypothetical protein